MTLTELKYCLALAKEKNFGRAAEKVFVSQPTLSIAVKKLEDELNVTLFERLKTEVIVTEIGRKILQQAARVQQEAAKIKTIAHDAQQGLTTECRLGAIFTVGPYIFPKLVPKLRSRVPELRLNIEENFTKVLTQKCLAGELDVMIIAEPFDNPSFTMEPLFEEPLFVIIPPDHAWCNLDTIEPTQLSQETVLLLGEGHCFRDDVLRACPNCGVNRLPAINSETMIEGTSLETLRHMVASGMGISVLPCSAINADQYTDNYFVVKPFVEPQPTRRISLAYRNSFQNRALIDLLRELIKTI